MTNNFTPKKSGTAARPQLSPEEYAANRNLMMSIDVIPVPTDEAVREAESRLLGVETNATNWQRRQNANNNFSAQLPYDIEQQRKEMKEFLDDLTTRDQRMMFAVLTMVHTADTKEQLDNDTEALLMITFLLITQTHFGRLCDRADCNQEDIEIAHYQVKVQLCKTTE